MIRFAVMLACLGISIGAHAGCSENIAHRADAAEHVLNSLHPDKPGQMRVQAPNGSEFSAGQVRWMSGQLKHAVAACERSDEQAAASALDGVTQLLSAHRPI